MNIVKIQQDLIKDIVASKGSSWFIQTNDSEVILFTKYQIYILDPEDWLLNTDQLIANDVKNIATAEQLLKTADDAKPAHKTGVTRSLSFQGKTVNCIELKREDNDELVYVDQALLKYYDKKAEFEVTDHKSPVYVYEDDILVGVVLPVKCEV